MIVVTGADGQIGTAFSKILSEDDMLLTRRGLDLTNLDRIGPTIAALEPSVVINCAAYTAVDRAETDEDTANAVNGYAVEELAGVCREIGAQFITFSTDYVFDGNKDGAYVESDSPNPINAYGRSKLLGERLALDANPDSLIIRTSWLSSGTHPNFVRTILRRLSEGEISVVDDQFGRPTMADDLVQATFAAIENGVTGILHLTNAGTTTWFGLAREVAQIAGMDTDRVHPCAAKDYPTSAARPMNSVLHSERLATSGLTAMCHHHESLVRAVREMSDDA